MTSSISFPVNSINSTINLPESHPVQKDSSIKTPLPIQGTAPTCAVINAFKEAGILDDHFEPQLERLEELQLLEFLFDPANLEKRSYWKLIKVLTERLWKKVPQSLQQNRCLLIGGEAQQAGEETTDHFFLKILHYVFPNHIEFLKQKFLAPKLLKTFYDIDLKFLLPNKTFEQLKECCHHGKTIAQEIGATDITVIEPPYIPNNLFTALTCQIGDKDFANTYKIDLTFVQTAQRYHLFSIDNFGIELIQEGQKTPRLVSDFGTQESSKKTLIMAMIDKKLKLLRISDIATVNKNGWPRVLNLMSKGYYLLNSSADMKKLYEQTLYSTEGLERLFLHCHEDHNRNDSGAFFYSFLTGCFQAYSRDKFLAMWNSLNSYAKPLSAGSLHHWVWENFENQVPLKHLLTFLELFALGKTYIIGQHEKNPVYCTNLVENRPYLQIEEGKNTLFIPIQIQDLFQRIQELNTFNVSDQQKRGLQKLINFLIEKDVESLLEAPQGFLQFEKRLLDQATHFYHQAKNSWNKFSIYLFTLILAKHTPTDLINRFLVTEFPAIIDCIPEKDDQLLFLEKLKSHFELQAKLYQETKIFLENQQLDSLKNWYQWKLQGISLPLQNRLKCFAHLLPEYFNEAFADLKKLVKNGTINVNDKWIHLKNFISFLQEEQLYQLCEQILKKTSEKDFLTESSLPSCLAIYQSLNDKEFSKKYFLWVHFFKLGLKNVINEDFFQLIQTEGNIFKCELGVFFKFWNLLANYKILECHQLTEFVHHSQIEIFKRIIENKLEKEGEQFLEIVTRYFLSLLLKNSKQHIELWLKQDFDKGLMAFQILKNERKLKAQEMEELSWICIELFDNKEHKDFFHYRMITFCITDLLNSLSKSKNKNHLNKMISELSRHVIVEDCFKFLEALQNASQKKIISKQLLETVYLAVITNLLEKKDFGNAFKIVYQGRSSHIWSIHQPAYQKLLADLLEIEEKEFSPIIRQALIEDTDCSYVHPAKPKTLIYLLQKIEQCASTHLQFTKDLFSKYHSYLSLEEKIKIAQIFIQEEKLDKGILPALTLLKNFNKFFHPLPPVLTEQTFKKIIEHIDDLNSDYKLFVNFIKYSKNDGLNFKTTFEYSLSLLNKVAKEEWSEEQLNELNSLLTLFLTHQDLLISKESLAIFYRVLLNFLNAFSKFKYVVFLWQSPTLINLVEQIQLKVCQSFFPFFIHYQCYQDDQAILEWIHCFVKNRLPAVFKPEFIPSILKGLKDSFLNWADYEKYQELFRLIRYDQSGFYQEKSTLCIQALQMVKENFATQNKYDISAQYLSDDTLHYQGLLSKDLRNAAFIEESMQTLLNSSFFEEMANGCGFFIHHQELVNQHNKECVFEQFNHTLSQAIASLKQSPAQLGNIEQLFSLYTHLKVENFHAFMQFCCENPRLVKDINLWRIYTNVFSNVRIARKQNWLLIKLLLYIMDHSDNSSLVEFSQEIQKVLENLEETKHSKTLAQLILIILNHKQPENRSQAFLNISNFLNRQLQYANISLFLNFAKSIFDFDDTQFVVEIQKLIHSAENAKTLRKQYYLLGYSYLLETLIRLHDAEDPLDFHKPLIDLQHFLSQFPINGLNLLRLIKIIRNHPHEISLKIGTEWLKKGVSEGSLKELSIDQYSSLEEFFLLLANEKKLVEDFYVLFNYCYKVLPYALNQKIYLAGILLKLNEDFEANNIFEPKEINIPSCISDFLIFNPQDLIKENLLDSLALIFKKKYSNPTDYFKDYFLILAHLFIANKKEYLSLLKDQFEITNNNFIIFSEVYLQHVKDLKINQNFWQEEKPLKLCLLTVHAQEPSKPFPYVELISDVKEPQEYLNSLVHFIQKIYENQSVFKDDEKLIINLIFIFRHAITTLVKYETQCEKNMVLKIIDLILKAPSLELFQDQFCLKGFYGRLITTFHKIKELSFFKENPFCPQVMTLYAFINGNMNNYSSACEVRKIRQSDWVNFSPVFFQFLKIMSQSKSFQAYSLDLFFNVGFDTIVGIGFKASVGNNDLIEAYRQELRNMKQNPFKPIIGFADLTSTTNYSFAEAFNKRLDSTKQNSFIRQLLLEYFDALVEVYRSFRKPHIYAYVFETILDNLNNINFKGQTHHLCPVFHELWNEFIYDLKISHQLNPNDDRQLVSSKIYLFNRFLKLPLPKDFVELQAQMRNLLKKYIT